MLTFGWPYHIAITSLPLLVLLILSPILVSASLRWLAARGRLGEATTILHHATRIDGSQLPSGNFVNEELPSIEEPEPLLNASESRKKLFLYPRALLKP